MQTQSKDFDYPGQDITGIDIHKKVGKCQFILMSYIIGTIISFQDRGFISLFDKAFSQRDLLQCL